jgi:hypothetical protein
MKDPTERFSSRVHNYVKYRPRYPQEVSNFILESAEPNLYYVRSD